MSIETQERIEHIDHRITYLCGEIVSGRMFLMKGVIPAIYEIMRLNVERAVLFKKAVTL